MKQGRYTEPNPSYGDLIPVDEFRDMVRNGTVIDSDGEGSPSNGTHIDPDTVIYPFSVAFIPGDATHIMWFNK